MSTPTAPDLETLLDFETQIENACADIIEDDTNIQAGSINITLQQDDLTTPRVEIRFELTEAQDQPVPRSATDPAIDYDKHSGNLIFRIVTDGSVNGSHTIHREYRAKVRKAFLISRVNFNEVNLPYYEIRYLRPMGTLFFADDDHLVSELTYQVEFGYRADAWPPDPEPEPEPDPEP